MYARRRTAVVSVATSFLVLALAPPGRASGWKVSYAFSGQDTSTATGRADQTTDWPAGPVPDPLSRTVAASASQGPNSVSVSASSIGVVTVTLTWDRAPNDMNDKPPDKIMVKQTAVATWRGQFSPLQGMTPSFQFSGSLSNGLGSPIVLTNTDLTRSGSCSGVQVLEFKSPNDYNRDAQDPITVTLPQVTIRANASGTGSGGTTSATSSLTYSAGVIDWHAHRTNFRQVDQHAYNNDDAGAPSLWFKYLWDSTSGDLADLGQVRIGEWVTYDGNAAPPGLYQYNVGNYTDIPQGPIPYGYWIPHQDPYVINGVDQAHQNPERGHGGNWVLGSGTVGMLTDTHLPLNMSTNYPAAEVVYTSNQVYGFRCDICMASDPPSYFQVLLRPGAITRSIRPYTTGANATWKFVITKSGLTASKIYP